MIDSFTQAQLDLIDMLIERGIKREMKDVRKELDDMKFGHKTQYERTTGE